MSATVDGRECASCGDDLDDADGPRTVVGDGREVCDPSCAFDLLGDDGVAITDELGEAVNVDDNECPACAETMGPAARRPETYNRPHCGRCADEMDRRLGYRRARP